MQVRKALITAALRAQRHLPIQTLEDQNGDERSLLYLLAQEALNAGIKDIGVVICPGERERYREAAGELAPHITFIEQHDPRGYGHAIYCAREYTGDEAFLHIVGDHLFVSTGAQSCASRLVQVAQANDCAVSAVQPTRESQLPYYGCVGGRRVAGARGMYEIERVLEKPTPTVAEQELVVPGLRAGRYLCFFGMHVLPASIHGILAEQLDSRPGASINLSGALDELARRERYLALIADGTRYDVGVRYGMLIARLALALSGSQRDQVLTKLVELLAETGRNGEETTP